MESGRVLIEAPLTVAPARPKIERFGRYYLLECIGRGGMAEVFRAVTQGVEGFRRTFVVKRILADKAGSPEFVRMFGDEARICALLHHPNIVQVYDFGQVGVSYFLAMEYLLGKDLASVMRGLRASNLAVPYGLAAFIAHEVALGLAYAHTLRSASGQHLGIVHRDISPANIMLLHAGGVKVLDFGIAKATAAAQQPVTTSGKVKGKFGYLSPEQARAQDVDGRSDLFALGITLWEMLTGRRLFAGANELETLQNVLTKPVPPPSAIRPEIPREMDALVLKAVERDVDRRYQSAQQMADDLEQIMRDARYESQSQRRLLQELFGDESSSLSAVVPEIPDDLSGRVRAMSGAVPQQRADQPSLEIDVVEAAPAPPRPRRALWALGVLLVGAAGFLAARPLLRTPIPLAALTSSSSSSPSSPSALPAAAAPTPAPAPAAAPVLPTTVTLRLDSNPAGAQVRGPDGTALGTTPIEISLPRAADRQAFTLAKEGFRSATYEVAPERDSSAFIELPRLRAPVPRGGAASGPRPRRGGRAHDLGDGMTLNPF